MPTSDDLRHWPLAKLREIHVEMGKQCNVRCAMCYQTDFSPATKASELIWKERLLPAYEAAQTLTLSGGEPTIMPAARELLELVMRDYPHLELNLVTNGVLFRGIWEDAFLKQGAFLNFSLNAIDPERYRRVVQFGKQEQVIANINRIVQRRNETGSRLKIRASAVIIEETLAEMPIFVQWCAEHGLDQALLFADHLGQPLRPEPKLVQKYIAEAYAIADSFPNFKLIHLDDFDWYYASQHHLPPVRQRPVMQKEPAPCPIAFDTLFVNPDGAAKPCCKSWYLFGNLLKSSLEEAWNSEAAFRFRARMIGLDFRDCMVACDLNAKPIHPKLALARKAYWVVRRDPKSAVKKGLRKFGLTSAQKPAPVESD